MAKFSISMKIVNIFLSLELLLIYFIYFFTPIPYLEEFTPKGILLKIHEQFERMIPIVCLVSKE